MHTCEICGCVFERLPYRNPICPVCSIKNEIRSSTITEPKPSGRVPLVCHVCRKDIKTHMPPGVFAPICETCSGAGLKNMEDVLKEIDEKINPPAYVIRNKGDLKCETCGVDLDEGVYITPKCYACRIKDGDPLDQRAAIKYDTDKAQFHLIPVEPLVELGNLYLFGAQKYEADNWKKGMAYSRVFNALLRHLYAWWYEREPSDKETRLHHLASVAWCAFTLMWYDFKEVGEDDRPIQS